MWLYIDIKKIANTIKISIEIFEALQKFNDMDLLQQRRVHRILPRGWWCEKWTQNFAILKYKNWKECSNDCGDHFVVWKSIGKWNDVEGVEINPL